MRTTTRLLGSLAVLALLGATAVTPVDGAAAAPASARQPATTACGEPGHPPARYRSVVVFAFENRTWSDVGPGFGRRMPYLHQLGRRCAWFRTWDETDPDQDSLAQYVGQVTGARQPGTVDDCSPSARCSTRADSIFRQLRHDGRSAVSFVAGATRRCSADHNAPRHVPALYLRAPEDRRHCRDQVRPLAQLDVRHLPAFAFVTPDECDDGHDCGNRTVDRWAHAHIQPVLDSRAYRNGHVAVFVWYDEDRPVPNLWITPTARRGPVELPGAGAAGTLRAWQSMLGLDCLEAACSAPDMRASANS